MKLYFLVLVALLSVAGCSTPTTTAPETDPTASASPTTEMEPVTKTVVNESPEAALKAFTAAIKAKDEDALRATLSDKTLKIMDLNAKMAKKTLSDMFDGDAFKDLDKGLETRNEKIDGDSATLEVKDPNGDKWDPMPFAKEDGSWKIAMGDKDFDKDYETMKKMAEKIEAQPKDADDKSADKEATEKNADKGDKKPVSDN